MRKDVMRVTGYYRWAWDVCGNMLGGFAADFKTIYMFPIFKFHFSSSTLALSISSGLGLRTRLSVVCV
jgi:hypothetical protein